MVLNTVLAVLSAFEPGRWKIADRGRDLAVEIGVVGVVLGAELDAGDIAHAGDAAVGVGRDHDVVELLGAASAGRASAPRSGSRRATSPAAG